MRQWLRRQVDMGRAVHWWDGTGLDVWLPGRRGDPTDVSQFVWKTYFRVCNFHNSVEPHWAYPTLLNWTVLRMCALSKEYLGAQSNCINRTWEEGCQAEGGEVAGVGEFSRSTTVEEVPPPGAHLVPSALCLHLSWKSEVLRPSFQSLRHGERGCYVRVTWQTRKLVGEKRSSPFSVYRSSRVVLNFENPGAVMVCPQRWNSRIAVSHSECSGCPNKTPRKSDLECRWRQCSLPLWGR